MISKNTVFIIGAGAGVPYEFPTGKQLKAEIIHGFTKRYIKYFQENKLSDFEIESLIPEVEKFINTFRSSKTESIDLFLSRHPRLMEIGKHSIVLSIWSKELQHYNQEKHQIIDNWFEYLYQKMTENFDKKDIYNISSNHVSFVIFNYDRMIEFLLYRAFKNSFEDIPTDRCKGEINKFDYIHIYGQCGKLPWQDSSDHLKYGAPFNSSSLDYLSDQIFILKENRINQNVMKARQLILSSRRIFFLGFGYRNENLKILNLPDMLKPGQKVFGTGIGLFREEIDRIKENYFINKTIKPNDIVITNDDCLDLLRRYL